MRRRQRADDIGIGGDIDRKRCRVGRAGRRIGRACFGIDHPVHMHAAAEERPGIGDGRSQISLQARLECGWKAFFARMDVWKASAPLNSKLQVLHQVVQACVLYGAES